MSSLPHFLGSQVALRKGFDLAHRFLPRLEASRLPNSPVQQQHGGFFNESHLQTRRRLASCGEAFPTSLPRQQQELPDHSGVPGSMELSQRHETQLETLSKQLENLTALVAAHGQLLESMGKHITERQLHD